MSIEVALDGRLGNPPQAKTSASGKPWISLTSIRSLPALRRAQAARRMSSAWKSCNSIPGMTEARATVGREVMTYRNLEKTVTREVSEAQGARLRSGRK